MRRSNDREKAMEEEGEEIMGRGERERERTGRKYLVFHICLNKISSNKNNVDCREMENEKNSEREGEEEENIKREREK
jgi:hypothetical protein